MKYKFIGTEQDLIDNYFIPSIEDDLYYLGRDNQEMNGVEVRINVETEEIDNNYIHGRDIIDEDIQDLIDKGLVVEE